jgi:glycosyltransferase involved in cell wall biosynthesis
LTQFLRVLVAILPLFYYGIISRLTGIIRKMVIDGSKFISFIIPSHNVESYIEDCLNSICLSKINNYEIIIVDDNSTDNTLEVIKKFIAYNNKISIRVILKKDILDSKPGPGSSRNIAIKMAVGKYIAFIDSDDWINVNSYLNLAEILEKHECDFGWLRAIVYNENKGEFRNFNDQYFYSYLVGSKKFAIIDKHNSETSYLEPSNCNRVFNREFFINNVYPFPEDYLYEDLPTSIRSLGKARKIAIMNAVGYYYRIGKPERRTERNDDSRFDISKIIDQISNDVKSLALDVHNGGNITAKLVDFCFWCIESISIDRRKELISLLSVSLAKLPQEWLNWVLSENRGDDAISYKLWILLNNKYNAVQLFISARYDAKTSLGFYRNTKRKNHIKLAIKRRVKSLLKLNHQAFL